MTIKLYTITDDKRKVVKIADYEQVTPLATLTAHFKADVDILDPVLEVEYSANIAAANYFYVPDWGRCYFIIGITTGAQRCYVSGHVDVLQSYKDSILDLQCVIARQEQKDSKHSNGYLNDPMWINLQPPRTIIYEFPQKFHQEGNYVIAVGGGA